MTTRIELALDATGGGRADVRSEAGDVPARAPETAPHDTAPDDTAPDDTAPDDTAPAVVVLTGPLSQGTGHPLTDRLCLLLRRFGSIVVDLSGVELTHTGAVHAFVEATARAGEWPEVRLALAAPDATTAALLARSHVAERVPVHPDVVTALAHLDERPELVRGGWRFGIDPHAPGHARQHVRRVCRHWTVDEEAREAAEIVITELVTNAVEHAVSASVVEVERREHSLRLAVRDFDLAPLPEAHVPDPSSSRGRGLAMVAAVAAVWGVEAHRDGKTVWAEMATAP